MYTLGIAIGSTERELGLRTFWDVAPSTRVIIVKARLSSSKVFFQLLLTLYLLSSLLSAAMEHGKKLESAIHAKRIQWELQKLQSQMR